MARKKRVPMAPKKSTPKAAQTARAENYQHRGQVATDPPTQTAGHGSSLDRAVIEGRKRSDQ